jgi:predicted RNA-binding protein with PIN domain
MIYFIDGYNLLFRLFHSEKKLEIQRNLAIEFLQEKVSFLNLNIYLIFDGYQKKQELPTRDYYKHLKVIYTPKDQTADDYILEQIFLSKTPSQITVVTSDNTLKKKAKQMHAHTFSIESFIAWLYEKEKKRKKNKNEEKNNFIDTKSDIERLHKIFEEKLKKNIDDWE